MRAPAGMLQLMSATVIGDPGAMNRLETARDPHSSRMGVCPSVHITYTPTRKL